MQSASGTFEATLGLGLNESEDSQRARPQNEYDAIRIPTYWRMATAAEGNSTNKLVRMDEESISHFQKICTADDPSNFGEGRDYRDNFNRGQEAVVVDAWRIENGDVWGKYAAGRQQVRNYCRVPTSSARIWTNDGSLLAKDQSEERS
jgi:hypothetical protein